MLIVMHHTDTDFYDRLAPGLDNALQSFRVPMYYFLSGLFFKHYSGLVEFLRRKVNNLIVPFVFFHLLGFVVTAIVHPLLHPGVEFNWQGFSWLVAPLWTRFWPFTQVLWFLVSLFEVNVIYYYVLSRWLRRWPWRLAVLLLLSVVPLWLAQRGIALPWMLDTALVGLVYFAVGNAVSQAGLLAPHRLDRWGMAVFLPVAVGVWLTAGHIDILQQQLPSWTQLYLVPVVAILALLWLCKNVTCRVPVVAVWGQYSLIVLGTHDLLLTPLDALLAASAIAPQPLALLKWGITMTAMLVIIPLMVRFLPRFTAQKPLFK